MTDNIDVTPGSGRTVATDDVGGVHYQIVKLAFGALDTANVVAAASGKTFPITMYNSTGTEITFNANGQATAANSAPVTMPSDRQNSQSFKVAMSTDTSAYGSGDLIADTQQLDAFFNKTDGRGVITSVTIVDQDAQGAALYVLFHVTSTSAGTENSAPNISDANAAAGLQGIVAVATSDYVTWSGTKIATVACNIPVKAVSGTDDLYVSILNGTGTPTYTATGLNLTIGAVLD